ncbi:hypothetical protein DDB_G0284343 [Dictyostelium discoideum AX4]|uniref:Uncharacterized protein n=1 Tax=Dictyostelium discoideum TaxID=44689 RepID=Q54PT4_DICDI|nr:hypothetical protein DDB_G0284343 [Dictyostelium discoideum AX4]EAL65220.1 hypothetical protein DDB_G0284343 [Dictyostelium discoideum AX4]|eukprot:XP_638570.1 hypothetical protein DDB_G0284343 [Dictyostelium discoideum AX4]
MIKLFNNNNNLIRFQQILKRNYSNKKVKNVEDINIDSSNDNNTLVQQYVNKEYESYKIHKPVFIKEVLEILNPQPNKVYIDATFGMGGHSRGILETCKDCYVIAFDRDPKVFEMTKPLRSEFKDRLITINSTFSSMRSALKEKNLDHLKISGILYDFGVSSYQIDTADRGFSFKKELEGPLDMRMNQNSSQITAYDIINTFSEKDLRDIFFYYGEEKHTKNIANEILRKRKIEPIKNTSDLVKIVESSIPYPMALKTISRVFRSLRMFVNDELNEIKIGLTQGEQLLEPNSPLLAISFHSIEDRIVKQYLNKYTTIEEPTFKFSPTYKSPIFPSKEELEWNPRSKSAILRTAIRTSNKPISSNYNII